MGEQLFPAIGAVVEGKENTNINGEAAQEEEQMLQEVESLCMKCGEQGTTRMLLVTIPYFREVIVMSFRCEHCGTANNEIQAAGTIRPEGTIYTARILSRSDMDRQLVRSGSCEILIPEFELTLPASGRGQLTTVEGLIRDVVVDLSLDQPLRRIQDEESYEKIETLLNKMRTVLPPDDDEDDDDSKPKKEVDKEESIPPFTVKLDDPSGNSWIEFVGSISDPKWNMRTYPRTLEQNVALGLISQDDAAQAPAPLRVETLAAAADTEAVDPEHPNDDVYVFPGTCSSCGHPVDTRMKKVIIPYFKDILIMSTNCDRCGYRDNEVKSGSAISPQGRKITLRVEDREDLSRDILKSETSGLEIPEIDLILQPGTLGGRFTTLEGILDQIHEELAEKVFTAGDSGARDDKGRMDFEAFLKKLKDIKSAEQPFTIILDDPLANSYVQNLYAPDPDPNMTIETYERTWDQNEELGLNDMKVEGYESTAEDEDVPADLGTAPLPGPEEEVVVVNGQEKKVEASS